MKLFRLISIAILASALFITSGVKNEVKAQPGLHITFQTFYNDLAPYGRWMNNPQYGSVWIPNVSNDFHPYMSNGNWMMTDYGNTWVSDFAWGWGPFHYGRWFIDDYYGWTWVPGYEWGPAWVSWRNGGGYYGWAPLGPGMNIGINIAINIPSPWWVFLPQRYYMSNRWYNYCVPRNRVVHVYNNTTIINNYYNQNNRVYSYGPRRDEITQVTRRNVDVYRPEYVGRERYVSNRNGNYVDNSTKSRSSFIASNGRSNGENNRTTTGNGNAVNRSSGRNTDAGINGSQRTTTNSRNSGTYSTPESATGSRSSYGRAYEAPANTRSSGSVRNTESNTNSRSSSGRTYEAPASTRSSGSVGNTQNSTSGRSTGNTNTSRSRPETSAPRVQPQRSSESSAPRVSPQRSSGSSNTSGARQSSSGTNRSSGERSSGRGNN